MAFVADNAAWSAAHPEEAARISNEKKAAAASELDQVQPAPGMESTVAAEVAKAEGQEPAPEAKPAGEAAAAATPAMVEQWTTTAPELKAVFEKHPEIQESIMTAVRGLEAAKPVLDIVSTPEEATFAVEHAQRLVSIQANCMLGADDPEILNTAHGQFVDMFVERNDKGEPVLGSDGKPKLGADYDPFTVKIANDTTTRLLMAPIDAKIAELTAKLNGVYPNDDAKAADTEALQDAKYAKAAFEYTLAELAKKGTGEPASKLPALPPNATPEQVAYQKELERQQAELDAKQGVQNSSSRKAARTAVNKEVQNTYEATITGMIDSTINGMKERGEYLPEFVLTDKWTNPATHKQTDLPEFAVKCYSELTDKINSQPLTVGKLRSLEALGAAGKEARVAELTRLTNLYLPTIIQNRVQKIQDGIRESQTRKPAPGVVQPGETASAAAPRVEPASAGTVQPAVMDKAAVRSWAQTEAAKQQGYEGMTDVQKEQLIISLSARKRAGLV